MFLVVFQQLFTSEGSIPAGPVDGGLWGAPEASGLSGLHPQSPLKIHIPWDPPQQEHIMDFPPREGQLTLQCLKNHFTLKRYGTDNFSVVLMTVNLGYK